MIAFFHAAFPGFLTAPPVPFKTIVIGAYFIRYPRGIVNLNDDLSWETVG